MDDRSCGDDRVWRIIEEQRARSIDRLEAVAATAQKRIGPVGSSTPSRELNDLTRMLARDLTALGLTVHTSPEGLTAGGVWLGTQPYVEGVIVSWIQHDASLAVLGPQMHAEMQRQMRLHLYEVLHTLGYRLGTYAAGWAHLVTGLRPPIADAHTRWDE